jgi:UDP-GlcNAc:undecaprenyl-phosphate/decaprenyl-phosphate GlcNAc-1-phosphate transferase
LHKGYWGMKIEIVSANLATSQPTLLTLAVVFGLAAILGALFCWLVLIICTRWHIMSQPKRHHIHGHPVPRLGGVGIFLAFFLVSALFFRPVNDYEKHVYVGLIAASVLTVIIMAYDDIRGLAPMPRLIIQTVAALIAMFPAGYHGTLIEVLHNPLLTNNQGQVPLGLWLAIPFTWFWIVGMMNTINWIDGVDGLAGGVVTITALVMAAISWLLGQPAAALLCAALAGATLGFLPLNWHPARLFMGDSGAMFLGLSLAILANVGGAKLATMLLLLGLPILDTARVIVLRLRLGHSPLHFDLTHLHHRLLIGGLSQQRIVLLFYSMTGCFGAIAICAAFLQTRVGLWSVRLHIWKNFYLSVSELPTLAGLGLALVITQIIWRYAAYRRRRSGLPPGASSAFHTLENATTGTTLASGGAAGHGDSTTKPEPPHTLAASKS